MSYLQKEGMIYDPEDGQTIAIMSNNATPEQAALLASAPDLAVRVEELENTLLQCLPFFEDWKDEDGVYKPQIMAFMIKLIRKSLGE